VKDGGEKGMMKGTVSCCGKVTQFTSGDKVPFSRCASHGDETYQPLVLLADPTLIKTALKTL